MKVQHAVAVPVIVLNFLSPGHPLHRHGRPRPHRPPRPGPAPQTHHDLRARTVDFMQSNLKMFKELEAWDVWELDGAACSPEEYFDHMRPSGVHAGVPELFALARMLHTDIVVFQHQAPQVQMFQADGAPSQDVQDSAAVTNRIRVSYRCHAYSNACHYDAVVPHGHEKKGKKRSRSHGKKGKKRSPTNRTNGRKRRSPKRKPFFVTPTNACRTLTRVVIGW